MTLEYLGKAVTFVFHNKVLKDCMDRDQEETVVFHFVDENDGLIQIVLDAKDVPQAFFSSNEKWMKQALQQILDLSQYNLPGAMHILADPYPNEFPLEFQYISDKR